MLLCAVKAGKSQRSTSSLAPDSHILRIAIDDQSYKEGIYDLWEYLYYLPDSIEIRDFSEVSSADLAGAFIPLNNLQRIPQGRQEYWLRLTIQSDLIQPETWLINLMMADVESYALTTNGNEIRNHSGMLVPLSQRHFSFKYGHLPFLPLAIPENGYQTYYFKIKNKNLVVETDFGVELDFSMLSPSFASHYRHQDGTIMALNVGFYLAVGIYYFIIFFYIREISYLWFALYCFASTFGMLTLSGYAIQYLWPESPTGHYFFFRSPGLIGMNLFLVLFTRSYLRTTNYAPSWNKILWIVLGLLILFIGSHGIVLYFTDSPLGTILLRLGQNVQMLLALTIFLTAIQCLRNGYQPAKLYLFASAAFLLGMILNVLNVIQVLPQIAHWNWITVGRLIQLILFSFGLAQLFKYLLNQESEALRLKELDLIKTKVYTNITHEFRTPLTIILGMVEQIKNNPRQWYEEGMQMIQRNGKILLHFVNQLLDLAKLEFGAMPIHPIHGDILSYIRYVAESFHSLAESKSISLKQKTDLNELHMDYDPRIILHILSNLLSNAIRFTPEGGEIEIMVHHTDLMDNNDQKTLSSGSVVFSVSDTGPGISPHQLPHIFNRFYRIENNSLNGHKGTGIGLALTRELVDLLNGKISVENVAGGGARFIVILPITHEAPEGSPGIEQVKELISQYDVRSIQQVENLEPEKKSDHDDVLLIIEDNVDVIKYLRSCLSNQYQIEVALDGKTGVQKAVDLVPDLIISDIMMPEMDGFAVCQELKVDEKTSHIPIVLLTAKTDIASRIEGFSRGADAYLTKPFSQKELLVRLQNLIELRRKLRARYSSLEPLSPTDDEALRVEDLFIEKLQKLLEERFGEENFGIADICQALQMSRAQLYRKVSALTGKPVATYIRSFRLLKARDLLLTSNLTISEVAYRTGYKDIAHFSRSFRKEFGINPSEL